MNLYELTKELWTDTAASRADALVARIAAATPVVESASRRFREWKPLRFYLSIAGVGGRSGRSGPTFSVRFSGQEVAVLTVAPHPMLTVKEKHVRSNRQFGLETEKYKGCMEWNGKKAREFRRLFESFEHVQARSKRLREHALESRIIKEMENSDDRATKFAGTLANIQPVELCGFPFQCPLPISASSGVPKASDGHIDILTRRGHGRGVRLGVWELKRPGRLKRPERVLEQAYIYTVTLALMLRRNREWYRVFGFKGEVPNPLRLETVVVASAENRARLRSVVADFLTKAPLVLESAVHVSLHAAYYTVDPLTVSFESLEP